MLTLLRIRRFIKAVEMDDDEVLGDNKEEILKSLVTLGRKYSIYYKSVSESALEKRIRSLFVKSVPAEIHDEAIDIIMECVARDAEDNKLPMNIYKGANRPYIYSIVQDYEKDEHNILVVDWAFGEKRYIPPESKVKKKKKKKSVLADEDWGSPELTEEELLDEIDTI